MTKAEKLKMCAGCEDDFYNGKNPYGIEECWQLKKAKPILKKKVSLSQVPPWNQAPIRVLNCRHERGYWFVGKDQTH